jgi:hypothetical protein
MTDTCALFARDRGAADVYRSPVPEAPVIAAAQQRLWALKADIMARAKQAGALRADVGSADIVLLIWGVIGTMDATRDVAPTPGAGTWRCCSTLCGPRRRIPCPGRRWPPASSGTRRPGRSAA